VSQPPIQPYGAPMSQDVPAQAAYAAPPAYAMPPAKPPVTAPPAAYGPPVRVFPGQPQPFGQLAVTSCRFCGSVPAVDTKFRGHQGMVVLMRFLHTDGPFCRDCGLGTFRHMTSRTLVQGWYGYGSMIITPITVLMNIARRGKVARLAPPQPNPFGPSRAPMNPGPRLLARPMTWIGLAIPFLLVALIVAIAVSGD
jgi:hypothetical protein